MHEALQVLAFVAAVAPLTAMTSWTEADAASSLRREEAVDGTPCHVIELTPKREDLVSKNIVLLWFGKDDRVPRRVEFCDDDGEQTKRIRQSGITNLGAIPVAATMKVETPSSGSSTGVVVAETKLNRNLPDDAFTRRALEQGSQ